MASIAVRLEPSTKSLIEKAARIKQLSVSDFIRTSALAEAEQIIRQQRISELEDSASEAFLKAINDPAVSPKLKVLLKENHID